MMELTRIGLVMILLMVAVGCPVSWQIIPRTQGAVMRDTIPLANVTVMVSRLTGKVEQKAGCQNPVAVATTDSDGYFTLDEARRRTLWVPIPGDPGSYWRVCIMRGEELLGTWDHGEIVRERDQLKLVCNLAKEDICILEE